MDKKPLVSVVCVTYMHGKYIEKALEGFISQKTNFLYEVIVAEDHSPDNSKSIIEKYKKKYPNIIKPIYQKHNKGMMLNYLDALKQIRGKYVAICDGDDYWTDNKKLQLQVDFLEKNDKYSMCCHSVKLVYLDGSKENFIATPWDYVSNTVKNRGYLTFNDFFPTNGISSSSVMYRWKLKKIPSWLVNCSGGDLFLHLYHSDKGKVGVIDKTMSVYQKHPGGIWWKCETPEHQLKFSKSYIYLLSNINNDLNFRHNKIISETIESTLKNQRQILKENFIVKKYIRTTKNFIKSFIFKTKFIFFIYQSFKNTYIWKGLRKIKKIVSYLFSKNYTLQEKYTNCKRGLNIFIFAIKTLYISNKFTNKSIDLLIIDDLFPQKEPKGFRNTEFIYYLNNKVITTKILCKNSCAPDYLGKSITNFYEDFYSFSKIYPQFRKKISLLNSNKTYTSKLAYVVFESLAYYNLDFFEKNHIPFVFTLYPGGMFAVNNEESDLRKLKIFSSQMFRKVIVTQKFTKNYLISKKLCKRNQIEYIPLGFSQINVKEVKKKKYFEKDKKTFDICFVAFNYTNNGFYKGYDLFLDVANILLKKYSNIHFHIVGNWNKDDANNIFRNKNITYYGIQEPKFFPEFFSKMDIFISLSRTNNLGAFDGFPLGVDAGFCGVTLLASDVMNQNTLFKDRKDIVLVKLNALNICKNIEYLYKNPNVLYKIGESGKKIFQKYTSADYQCTQRIKLFKNIINSEKNNS